MNRDTHVMHEVTRLRLLAAALELQHLTGTAANVVPIPGGDRVIVIGAPARVRALLDTACAHCSRLPGDPEGMCDWIECPVGSLPVINTASAPAPSREAASNSTIAQATHTVDKLQQTVRAALDQQSAAPGDDAKFLSLRLARVAKAVGVPMPEGMSHADIAAVAGTILGQIALKLERAAQAQAGGSDARDAARYRWLRGKREVLLLTGFFGNGCVNRNIGEVDAAIDAAITAAGQEGGGHG